ncbi:MAG: 2-isopropylmalate synthase [Treponema sp.]|nr:2-isopropylmalate synthase [Treponema sp.]
MKIDGKYKQFESVTLENRTWPGKRITKAPIWCAVDLRDGNQALINPMSINQKLEYFKMLVNIGFKQIEVGFPSSNDTEFNFIRTLVNENLIPDDVTIQVLCQSREHLIERTMESLRGVKKAIFHIYNATSPAQRKYNFGKSKEELIKIATDGIAFVKQYEPVAEGCKISLEYSPENFTQTEMDYALEICEAVADKWKASKENKIILNLPSTVEACLPNQFADQIEYFCTHIKNRESCIISLHNHNDRGEGVAQCEMGLLAGAERVEGCLFGNGERSGNLDIVTVALNMYTQGVNPELDFSNLAKVSAEYTRLTGMNIHPRTPYSGELVFTSFSGGHQDAIRKAMAFREKQSKNFLWDVPYLPIDPHDIGRQYEGIIRINSQSGKGGAAFILETNFGIMAPKNMHPIIGDVVKKAADELQRELSSAEVYDLFAEKWLNTKSPLNVLEITEKHIEGERGGNGEEHVAATATIEWYGKRLVITASGNGPLDAFVNAMKRTSAPIFNITSFSEHSIGIGSDTHAIAYVQLSMEDGTSVWGVGKSSNVGRAGVGAVVSALNFYLNTEN